MSTKNSKKVYKGLKNLKKFSDFLLMDRNTFIGGFGYIFLSPAKNGRVPCGDRNV